MDSIVAELGGELDVLYRVGYPELCRRGARSILHQYGNSVYLMAKTVYPERIWLPWRFSHAPKGVSRDPQVLLLAIDFLEKELNISSESEWYRVSDAQLEHLGLYSLIFPNGGLVGALTKTRPGRTWDPQLFQSKTKSS